MSASAIGKRIHRLRTEQGLTQRQLAIPEERISYAYISRVEHGLRNPSLRALRVLAEKLGTTALYLETGRRDKTCPHCHRAGK
jgi:transcriptional regulator with XRE-family HTH domain